MLEAISSLMWYHWLALFYAAGFLMMFAAMMLLHFGAGGRDESPPIFGHTFFSFLSAVACPFTGISLAYGLRRLQKGKHASLEEMFFWLRARGLLFAN